MQVAGLLVLNAHNVTDTSGDGFAVRLFRRGNQRGFIRALSDQPSFFAAGFNKASPHRDFRTQTEHTCQSVHISGATQDACVCLVCSSVAERIAATHLHHSSL